MGVPLHILIIAEAEDDVLLLIRELEQGGYDPIFEHVNTAKSMQTALRQKDWDVVIADYSMPRWGGLAALKIFHKQQLDIPFIFISSTKGEAFAVEAVKAGAHDYVLKENLSRLASVVEHELQEAQIRREHTLIKANLRESEARYRSLTDDALATLATAIIVLDADFKVVWANQIFADYFGLSPEALMGQDKRELIRNTLKYVFEDADQFEQKVLATYSNNTYAESFECHVLAEGKRQERWLECYSRPIKSGLYAGGRIEHYYDITQRKTAEFTLDTHARHQSALFLLSADMVATLDQQEICRSVVRGLHKTLGYGEVAIFLVDETTGERVLYATTHQSDLLPGFVRLKPGRGLSEKPLLDGRAHYVPDVTQEPNYIPGLARSRSEADIPIFVGGKVIGVLSVESVQPNAFSDDDFAVLTAVANQVSVALARAREHQEVKEAEIRYQTLFDGIPIGLYRTTIEGTFLDVNPALVGMLGYPDRETLLVTNARDLYLYPDDRLKWEDTITRNGLVLDFETRVHRYDGSVICVRSSARAVLSGDDATPLYYEGTLENITARRQAEQEVRRLKEFNEEIVQTMAEGIVVENAEGYYTFVNPAAVALLGYGSVEEMFGLHWRDIVPPDKHHITEAANKRRREGKSDQYELELARKNGERLPVLVSGTPRFEQGRFAGTLAVFTDISERVKSEAEIERRNRDLMLLNRVIAASAASSENKAILDTVCEELALAFDLPYAVALALNDEKTFVTPLGYYSAEEIPLASVEPFPVKYLPVIQQLLAEKTILFVEDARTDPRFITVHGWMRRYNLTSMLIFPFVSKDEVFGLFVLQATEKREFRPEEIELAQRVADQVSGALARARLDEEYRRLSAAIDQTVDSVIITNVAGEIVYVNPGFERVSGYSRNEVLGQHVNILNSGEHDNAFFEEMWQSILAGNIWHSHVINKKKDGVLYTDEVIITPVRNEAGEIINFVSVQRDVTHEFELEEQLRRSQRMEAVGQLTAGIAHDFNNLLTAINGFAELLQRQLPIESLQYEMAGKILQSGEHAAELINQLLAFSRKQVISPKVLNINHIIVNVDKILQRVIGEEIELSVNLSPGLWLTSVDPTQIEQVIINLAVNARDAMTGGGKLIIETSNKVLDDAYAADHLSVNPGEYILLAVSDTGHGMSKEIQAHIFEPFFTTKEVHEGTGLGLASVFGIVKQSGGNIWVYSEEGTGTTFKVYLPRATDDPFSSLLSAQIVDLPRGTETILLVEDETMVRDFAARVLVEQGYTILQAGNGREALQVSQQHEGNIHLLLTDVVMPEMGGKLLSEQIKLTYPDIKILFTSGYTDSAIIRQGILADDIVFIQKPFSPTELAVSVREILDT